MATSDGVGLESEPKLRQVTATLSPNERFPVPVSDGYSVYSALLAVLSAVDEDIGDAVHDSSFGSLHCSGLQGTFASSDRSHHKTLLPRETYELSLGIVHPDDQTAFQALVNSLVLEGETVELNHGELRVTEFESSNASHRELLDRASGFNNPTVEMIFNTATCIEEAGGVTTMFPHRWAVFNSLLGKWNRSCPENLELEVDRETVISRLIEKPDTHSYDTHSVLVNRVKNEKGETRNLFRQGFSGTCVYEFKYASESVMNAVTALALFAEYSGVGSAVARGCGDVSVEVTDQ